MLENRRRYAFSWYDYLFTIFYCSKFKKKSNSQTNLSFRNLVYKDGLKRFKQETDTIEIVKSIRQMKMLIKILLSKHQIRLLELEDSNLLCKDLDVGSQLEHQIVQNQNGIQVRSTTKSSLKTQNMQSQENEESEVEVEVKHEDLPKYLSKQSDDEFMQKINKIVSEFGNQENNPQNKKILSLAYGLNEDSIDEELNSKIDLDEANQFDDISSLRSVQMGNDNFVVSKFPTSKVVNMKSMIEKS